VFRLDREISKWCSALVEHGQFSRTEIDELRDHLLSEVREQQARGANDEEAFHRAVAKLGPVEALADEYTKNHRAAHAISAIANIALGRHVLGAYMIAVGGLMLYNTVHAYSIHVTGGFTPPDRFPLPIALVFFVVFASFTVAGLRLLLGRALGVGALCFVLLVLLIQVPIFGGLPDNGYDVAGGLQLAVRVGDVDHHIVFHWNSQVHVNSAFVKTYYGVNVLALLATLFSGTLLFDRWRRRCEARGVLEEDSDQRCVELTAGKLAIVPKGVWHTARMSGPCLPLTLTDGLGTQHRPV
jgi:hypothetical protein